MTIDAHVHLWDLATDPQPWIDPATMADIDRNFGVTDLESMLDACGVEAAVVVQASNSAEETGRLLSLRSPRIAGVIGWLDLTGDLDVQLATLPPADRDRLVGVRHLVQLDDDPQWLDRPDVGRSLDLLAEHDRGFDLVIRAAQLPLAADVVSRHPATRFVLDHLGGIADTDSDAERAWETGLRDLARHGNVVAKVSGLAGLTRRVDRFERLFAVAVDAFGPNRLMYGSDWPLAELGIGATRWHDRVVELVSGWSPSERESLTTRTATAHYRLDR